MTVGAMMGFSPAGGSAVGADSIGPIYDGVYGRIFAGSISASATGFRYYDAWPNGVEILNRTNASLSITNNAGPICFRGNSQQLASANTGSNGAALSYLRATELTPIGVFGKVDSSFTNSPVHMECPRRSCSITPAKNGFGLDTVIMSVLSTDGVINAVSGNFNMVLGTVDENYAEVGSLPDGSGTVAYVIGYTKLGGATQIGFYSTDSGTGIGTGLAGIRKILATDIASDWVHIDTVFGISIDQTDGHPIAALLNLTDTVAHGAYMVKINKTTGTIIWAIPLGGPSANVQYREGMKFNVIKNGRLWYLGAASNSLFAINTVAGTFTTLTLSNSSLDALHGDQCSEDVTDSVMWLGAWSEGTSHPVYLGNFCFTLGHNSGSGMIWRYFPNGTPNPAPVYGAPAASRKRAWTFTLDGHVFYVLDLGREGTFLYDTTTDQWSKFITQAWNGWNLTNGTMWGQRIVGGDFLTTDIWEMQPNAMQDNGATDIIHVVTGGLVKRNRVYASCDALRLNVSIGQLDDTIDATVQLSFSDDQGQTWTDMDTFSLVEGDVGNELTWRSLGSFAAPGRIFRVTDVGAFLRIDGADAGIDNFDEDGQQDNANAKGA